MKPRRLESTVDKDDIDVAMVRIRLAKLLTAHRNGLEHLRTSKGFPSSLYSPFTSTAHEIGFSLRVTRSARLFEEGLKSVETRKQTLAAMHEIAIPKDEDLENGSINVAQAMSAEPIAGIVAKNGEGVRTRWAEDDVDTVGHSAELFTLAVYDKTLREKTKQRLDATLETVLSELKTAIPNLVNMQGGLQRLAKAGTVIGAIADNREGKLYDRALELKQEIMGTLKETVLTLGLDPERFTQGNAVSIEPSRETEKFVNNILAAQEIEAEEKGAVAFLSKPPFDIQCFSRYPKELLVHQFRNRNTKGPHGVILVSQWDHNGAFYRAKDKVTYSKLMHSSNAAGHEIRLYELPSSKSGVRALVDANTRAKEKISFVFVGAHGNEKEVAITRDDRVSAEVLENLSTATNRLFAPSPTFIFASCSVGKRADSFLRLLKEKYGGKVFAPKTLNKGVTDIRAKIEKGQLNFDVEFTVPYGSYEVKSSRGRTF
jgi:hypothetical protein